MHDLHEADRILKLVLDHAERHKLKSVTKVVIGLGSVIEHGSEINPENLKFNIGVLARQTMAENAEVVVKKIKADTWELEEIEGDK
ncbi:hydrogenase maturation nickel metallochaperone HypA [Candidatus Falkowbacteria bacterium]|nr:hydrogenase maturation nickel metallochaperone HypA [Candidatus Falkowbacteria bacterium]